MLNAVFTFFANNRAAQWIAGAFAFVFLWKANNWHQRREGEMRQKVKHKEEDLILRERVRVVADEIIAEEKADADDARLAGEIAGRAEPADLGVMSDVEWQLTFGRPRQDGDPGYRS